MQKIEVDKEVCLGCELCVNKYPNLFEIKDGHSKLKDDADLNNINWEEIEKLSFECPTRSIFIKKEEKL